MNIRLHRGDLPDDYQAGASVAIDTETLGLNPHRDRLCLVQLSTGDGEADLVQIAKGQTERQSRPRADRRASDENLPFRPFRPRHPAKDLRHPTLRSIAPRSPEADPHLYRPARTEGSRSGNCSAWTFPSSSNPPTGPPKISSEAQRAYAASDVLHLHALREKLDAMLAREGRDKIAAGMFQLPARTRGTGFAGMAGNRYFRPYVK